MAGTRIPVLKTYKLYINGAFPRSESGRSLEVKDSRGRTAAHLCKASRKDLREAVEAARGACGKWAAATAYNRGQILYRIAEMMEGKRDELAAALSITTGTRRSSDAVAEVDMAIDRVIYFAGWADKYPQVLGCNNPVSGPFYNFTITEPSGVIACIAPDAHPLLGLISVIAPVIVSGNTCVALTSQTNPIAGAVFAEVCATSDVPAGVINILTGERAELIKYISDHRDIDGIHAATASLEESARFREGAAENIKRVLVRSSEGKHKVDWTDSAMCETPFWIEPFIEFKTVWHPASV
jgi:acyl-CoA reductase-like NAD-dependent aldehyde dehydrogenase